MKTFLLLLTCAIGLNLATNAQKKIMVGVYNNKNQMSTTSSPTDAMSIGNNGFVLSSQNDDKKSDITYYNTIGEPQWHVTAPKEYRGKGFAQGGPSLSAYADLETAMVSSNNGSWFYNVEMVSDKFYKKETYVTQVSKSGASKSFTITPREEMGRELQTIFSDDQYFYILTTEEGNENSKKKATEKLILNRFNAADFGYKKTILDLPPCGDEKYFWTYIGQSDTEKFLASKGVNEDLDKIVFTIAAFNAEGKVTRVFTIEPVLNGKFFRPAFGVRSLVNNFYQRAEFDYVVRANKDRTYTQIFTTDASFSQIQFDQESNTFFVFGLFGPKEYKKTGPVYDGFYIFKYDADGKDQWKLQQAADADLMAEGLFRVHAASGYRDIFLKVNPDHSVFFSIHVIKGLFSYQISAEGKVLKTSKQTKVKEDLTEPYEFSVKE